MKNNWLIFTDLDGTLLDFDTYDFSEALPAMNFLKERQIPVIPCTSKTMEEVLELQKTLALTGPFIIENGSAVVFPADYFGPIPEARPFNGLKVIVLGKERQDILLFFKELKERFSLKVKGFSEMEIDEICQLTHLSGQEARLAQKRLFSEPMVSLEENLSNRHDVLHFVQQNGFRLLQGNRFYHLIGNCDKGQAVKKLTKIFTARAGHAFKTMGLGDSKNDFEMLKAVNLPILVRKKDGNFVHLEGIENVYITQRPGPAGWAEAVFKFLKTK